MSNIRTVRRDKDGNELPPTSPLYSEAKRTFPHWWWDQDADGSVVTSFGFAGAIRLRVSGSGVNAELEYGFGESKQKIKQSWGSTVSDATRRVLEHLVDETARSMGLTLKGRSRPPVPSSPTTPTYPTEPHPSPLTRRTTKTVIDATTIPPSTDGEE